MRHPGKTFTGFCLERRTFYQRQDFLVVQYPRCLKSVIVVISEVGEVKWKGQVARRKGSKRPKAVMIHSKHHENQEGLDGTSQLTTTLQLTATRKHLHGRYRKAGVGSYGENRLRWGS
jgi:hypothetical protein